MGAFNRRGYVWAVPTDPGRATPRMHDARGPETAPDRSAADQQGGWQPSEWLTVQAGPCDSGPREPNNHYASGSHFGDRGRGDAHDDVQLDSNDQVISIDGPPDTLAHMGSAGAAHGGVRAKGCSLPWANPDGIRLGRQRTPLAVLHGAEFAQPLHFNRPKLRPFRIPMINHETNSPFPGVSPRGSAQTSPFNPLVPSKPNGMQTPHLRRTIRPFGSQEYHLQEMVPQAAGALDPGTIGGDYAL